MSGTDQKNILVFIRKLGNGVFTTHALTAISGRSASSVVQCLDRLVRQGLIIKLYRGIWADPGQGAISPFDIVPFLFPRQRVYVSFISALHLHGLVEQIPQTITLASLAHSRTIRAKTGVYSVHQIAPALFGGFDWYKERGGFLIAGPEKALIDSLYLSSRKKKQFGHFPELHFSPAFSFREARNWVERIPERNIRVYVHEKLKDLVRQYAPKKAASA